MTEQRLSASRFVLRPRRRDDAAPDLHDIAEIASLPGSRGWLATLKHSAGSPRDGWALLHARLGKRFDVIPALQDEAGDQRFPTGMLSVRFESETSDADLERVARDAKLELVARAKFTAQQALFRPKDANAVFLPELQERLGRSAAVESVWLDAQSHYQRDD